MRAEGMAKCANYLAYTAKNLDNLLCMIVSVVFPIKKEKIIFECIKKEEQHGRIYVIRLCG